MVGWRTDDASMKKFFFFIDASNYRKNVHDLVLFFTRYKQGREILSYIDHTSTWLRAHRKQLA